MWCPVWNTAGIQPVPSVSRSASLAMSPFFNFAIGQLLKDIAEVDLRRLLQIEHLNETGRLVVERVIENAAKYHGDKDYRKIVDDILEQQAKELD